MRFSICLIWLFFLSSCTLPFTVKIKGKCDGGIEFNELLSRCPLHREMALEADYEPE